MQIATPNLRFFYFLFTFSIRNSNSTVTAITASNNNINTHTHYEKTRIWRLLLVDSKLVSPLVRSWFACCSMCIANTVFAQRRGIHTTKRRCVQNNIKMSNKCMQMMTFSLDAPISKHTHTFTHTCALTNSGSDEK